jgi:hypothetical protein
MGDGRSGGRPAIVWRYNGAARLDDAEYNGKTGASNTPAVSAHKAILSVIGFVVVWVILGGRG